MSSIPLNPIGREEIHRLETALLLGTLFREDVLDILRDPEERITWVDSLAVAAASIAREAAKMSVGEIADDIGRSEAAVRQHLQGKSKAGRLVRETYERFVKDGPNINLPVTTTNIMEEVRREVSKYEDVINRLKKDLDELQELLNRLKAL